MMRHADTRLLAEHARAFAQVAGEVVAETLWPTRCAVCGTAGDVLCESCRSALPYLDYWRACPDCGAPFGMHQCTECNTFSLHGLGRSRLGYEGCVSAVAFADDTARIIRMRKDQGERRLARSMAFAIACAIPPAWMQDVVVSYVPSTRRALRERGFCHGRELAGAVADLLDVRLTGLLAPATTADQRALGRSQRAANVQGRFGATAQEWGTNAAWPTHVLLVDDVYTTGSTAMAAADALHAAGTTCVQVATFARVY